MCVCVLVCRSHCLRTVFVCVRMSGVCVCVCVCVSVCLSVSLWCVYVSLSLCLSLSLCYPNIIVQQQPVKTFMQQSHELHQRHSILEGQ